MAKRKKKRVSENVKAWRKEANRIKRYTKKYADFTFNFPVNLEQPKRVTKKAIENLKNINRRTYWKYATYTAPKPTTEAQMSVYYEYGIDVGDVLPADFAKEALKEIAKRVEQDEYNNYPLEQGQIIYHRVKGILNDYVYTAYKKPYRSEEAQSAELFLDDAMNERGDELFRTLAEYEGEAVSKAEIIAHDSSQDKRAFALTDFVSLIYGRALTSTEMRDLSDLYDENIGW